MNKQETKNQIDLDITNKTLVNSITPQLVGNNIKNVIDLFPNLIFSYEGNLNSLTIPIFKEGVLNIYKVTENFTYNTVVLKIDNIVGLTSTEVILITDNKNIKKINNTILPDGNGNAIIPNADNITTGLVNSTGTTQTFGGNKIIKGNGSTNHSAWIFDIQNLLGSSYFKVDEGGFVTINAVTTQIGGFLDFSPLGTNTLVGRIKRSTNAPNVLFIGDQDTIPNGIGINLATGNITLGLASTLESSTTNAKVEVLSTTKVSVPYPKMTHAQRLAITGAALVIGGGVYVTPDIPNDINEGLWIYKSTGWVKLI